MKFSIEIKADNAAFDTGLEGSISGAEVARILREAASKVDHHTLVDGHDGSLQDLNGNTVGFWTVED